MEKFFDFLKAGQHVNERIGYLITGFLTHSLTGEEREELDAWIVASDDNMKTFEEVTSEETIDTYLNWYAERDVEGRLKETKMRLSKRRRSVVRVWKYAVAAGIMLMLAVGGYILWPSRTSRFAITAPVAVQDIQPGSSKAVLKMEGGEIVDLGGNDSVIADGVMIREGTVVYNTERSGVPEYHEVSIPRKGMYKVVLPDGTKVWLNAESSIRYPTAFNGSERRVTVTGETFFEVHKDPAKPFLVNINELTVEALGTQFNINAYPNEPLVRTTLQEGSVRVSRGTTQTILLPGQQLQSSEGNWKVSKEVDMRSVTSWIHGELRWKDAGIRQVMREIERWYDARVVIEDSIDYHFNGTFNRNLPVSKILTLLEETGHVHFTIEGNTISVKK